MSRPSDKRERPPFGPPGGGCSPVSRSGKAHFTFPARQRPAKMAADAWNRRFAGPEDHFGGPHFGAREQCAENHADSVLTKAGWRPADPTKRPADCCGGGEVALNRA